MMLTIEEHASTKYAPRTWANAKRGDLTLAFAINFATAGEKCTREAAGKRYRCHFLTALPAPVAEGIVLLRANYHPSATLNIAGNGMNTLARYFWDQPRTNQWVYDVLKPVHEREPVTHVFCGGQTGVDLAGAVAAVKLGIPCTVLMPRGCLQRCVSGQDLRHTPEEIEAQIQAGVIWLC